MADQVEEVKQKTEIVALISESLTLKKAGRNYKGLCPFHSEKTPSFMVSPELQIFKCFGCGESGDVFTFLEKQEGMDFYEALKFLAGRAGIKLAPLSPGQASEKERLYELNSLTSRYYNYMLLTHPSGRKALKYLTQERGLKMETVKYFSLGFSPAYSRPLINLLVNRKKYQPQELARAGLVYPQGRDLVDRFAGRVIFPLFDHRGNTIGFAGRTLPGEEKDNVGKYINSPDSPLYHKSKVLYGLNWSRGAIKDSRSALIVEGELDLIACWQAGLKNIVAIKGSALTEEQADLLLRFADKVILALDADLAGNLAARRGIAQAYKKGLEIKVVRLKDYKDPDEAVRQNPAAFKRLIDQAVNVWDYLIEEVFKQSDVSSGEGKAKISRAIVPILASISDSIVQAHYLQLVAGKLGVPESAVSAEVRRGKPEFEAEAAVQTSQSPEEKSRRQILEERLLAVCFSLEPELLLKAEIRDLISGNLGRRILAEYAEFKPKGGHFSLAEFSRGLPKELLVGFSEMVLSLGEESEEPEKLAKELETIKKEIEKLKIKKKMTTLSKGIEEPGAKQDFSQLSQQLSQLEEK